VSIPDGGYYPFRIEVTTPRPTEEMAENDARVNVALLISSGSMGYWSNINDLCLKASIPIRDSPFEGLKSVPGQVSVSNSQVSPWGATAGQVWTEIPNICAEVGLLTSEVDSYGKRLIWENLSYCDVIGSRSELLLSL
jgi:hypothetical protein